MHLGNCATIFLCVIIQVYKCSANPESTQFSRNLVNKGNICYQEGNYAPHSLSRHRRGIEDLHYLREFEMNPSLWEDYRRMEEAYGYNGHFKGYKNNELKRSTEKDKELKKISLLKSNDVGFKKNTDKLSRINYADIPEDVKRFIINHHLSKLVEDNEKTSQIENFKETLPNSKYDTKDNIRPDYTVSKDIYPTIESKRHVEDILNQYLNSLDYETVSNLLSDDSSTGPVTKDGNEFSTQNTQNEKSLNLRKEYETLGDKNNTTPSQTLNNGVQLILDQVGGNETQKNANNQNNKSEQNTNDIKVVFRHDHTRNHYITRHGYPSEIKIVIKIPNEETQPDTKDEEKIQKRQTKNNVKEEIKNYINLATSLLKKIEIDEEYDADHDLETLRNGYQNHKKTVEQIFSIGNV